MGITGKSVFFNVPEFDVITDILPEPMHLLDAGFMKNTCGRAFNSGSGPQTRPGYKRTNPSALNDYVRYAFFCYPDIKRLEASDIKSFFIPDQPCIHPTSLDVAVSMTMLRTNAMSGVIWAYSCSRGLSVLYLLPKHMRSPSSYRLAS